MSVHSDLQTLQISWKPFNSLRLMPQFHNATLNFMDLASEETGIG